MCDMFLLHLFSHRWKKCSEGPSAVTLGFLNVCIQVSPSEQEAEVNICSALGKVLG